MWAKKQPTAKRWWCAYSAQTRENLFKCSVLTTLETPAENPVGGGAERDRER